MTRQDAIDEVLRIIAEREAAYPRLVAAKTLIQAEADTRMAGIKAAWSFLVDPALIWVDVRDFDTQLKIAEHLAEARGWKPSPPKGRRS